MNNIVNSFSQFFKNKNIVTIIGVVLIIAILYYGYNSQIERQVRPIRNIPIAKVEIPPGALITDEMIEYIDVAPIVFQYENVARSPAEVVGKYVDYNTIIPQGSLFYREILLEEQQLPDNVFTKVKDGDIPFYFDVTTRTTFGNSVVPGNKIDMYLRALDPFTGKVLVGRLIKNIEVLAVRDATGVDVFAARERRLSPAMIIFGLEPFIHNLIMKAEALPEGRVELIPVPHGGTVEVVEGTMVAETRIIDFISQFSIPNEELLRELDDETLERYRDIFGELFDEEDEEEDEEGSIFD